jgi:hypothetical protein
VGRVEYIAAPQGAAAHSLGTTGQNPLYHGDAEGMKVRKEYAYVRMRVKFYCPIQGSICIPRSCPLCGTVVETPI